MRRIDELVRALNAVDFVDRRVGFIERPEDDVSVGRRFDVRLIVAVVIRRVRVSEVAVRWGREKRIGVSGSHEDRRR